MASAGRILIIPKGNYNAAATYENLDLVFYNGDSWLCKKACVGITPSDGNAEYWHRFTEVDVHNKVVPFAQAGSRTNLASGDTVATGFGKIAKWFADMKSAAFAEIANNLTTATAGKVLDALQGKELADMIGSTNTNVTNLATRMTSAENAITEQNGKFTATKYDDNTLYLSKNVSNMDFSVHKMGALIIGWITVKANTVTAKSQTKVGTLTKYKPIGTYVETLHGVSNNADRFGFLVIEESGNVTVTVPDASMPYRASFVYFTNES